MIYLTSALLGLVFGSFANVCIYRLPLNKSVVKPRSFCPHCNRRIPALHNIPVVSFLILGGRCAQCRGKISWRYPAVELIMAGLFVFHAWRFDDSIPQMVLANFLAFHLLCISIIDFEHYIIPDELSLSLVAGGLATSFLNPFLTGSPGARALESLLSCVGGGAIMLLVAWLGEKAFKREAMGGGDVKLIAGTGAVLGWQGLYGPMFMGSILGGLAGLALLAMRKRKLGETLPFGPFLSIGAYVTCLWPGFWVKYL